MNAVVQGQQNIRYMENDFMVLQVLLRGWNSYQCFMKRTLDRRTTMQVNSSNKKRFINLILLLSFYIHIRSHFLYTAAVVTRSRVSVSLHSFRTPPLHQYPNYHSLPPVVLIHGLIMWAVSRWDWAILIGGEVYSSEAAWLFKYFLRLYYFSNEYKKYIIFGTA